jgi:hypothetical protein
MATRTAVVLPTIVQRKSPNQSSRNGADVDLLVWHETGGAYVGAVNWLRNPISNASAHLVVREDGQEVTQLVPLARKAWHAAAYNPRSIGVEHANVTMKGYSTEEQLRESARIFGWLCLHGNPDRVIPPRWARGGVGAGVCYHGELGTAGGNHPQCGPDMSAWLRFLELLHEEIARGGYRKTWAV